MADTCEAGAQVDADLLVLAEAAGAQWEGRGLGPTLQSPRGPLRVRAWLPPGEPSGPPGTGRCGGGKKRL